MSIVFNEFYKNDSTFINLHNVPNLKSKERKKGMVTILVGKNKVKGRLIDSRNNINDFMVILSYHPQQEYDIIITQLEEPKE
jgi:hypothetical protein